MAIVYIALGSNLGDRAGNITKAIGLLREKGSTLLKSSTMIETEPVGGPPQDKFLNAVIKIKTDCSPDELLSRCLSIEQKLGRVRTIPNGPRTVDLDILLYDDLTVNTPQLTIPHPRMWERDFVLEPLKEIDPQVLEKYSHARRKIN